MPDSPGGVEGPAALEAGAVGCTGDAVPSAGGAPLLEEDTHASQLPYDSARGIPAVVRPLAPWTPGGRRRALSPDLAHDT